MKVFIIILFLTLASAALAANVCVDTVCDTTTAEEDAGALRACEQRKGSSCTAGEARQMLVADFMNHVEEMSAERLRQLSESAGINKALLHAIAQDTSLGIPLATKCAVMSAAGVQTAYESIYNVTCP